MPSPSTKDRILDAALASFASRGYEATSLDAVGKGLDLTKQSILYWFPSKDALLEAVIARSAGDLSVALETALQGAGEGWGRVEAVVRSVFRVAARQPDLLGFLREVGRLGPPAATQMTLALDPLVQRASSFLEAEMDAGAMRRHDPRLLLLAIYSTVIGMVTEVEVLRALGEEPTARSLVRRRKSLLQARFSVCDLRTSSRLNPETSSGHSDITLPYRQNGGRRLRGIALGERTGGQSIVN